MKAVRALLITSFCFIFISGCATTPDIGQWAQSSADLAGVIAAEQKAAITQIDAEIIQAEIADKEGWVARGLATEKYKANRKQYKQNTEVVNGVLSTMVLYADAVAKLAATGETGEEAADSIVNSMSSIVEIAGEAFEPADVALQTFKEITKIWTTVQAQDSLAKTMVAMNPVVRQLGEDLKALTAKQATLLTDIYGNGTAIRTAKMGANQLNWYLSTYDSTTRHQRIEKLFSSKKPPNTPPVGSLQDLAARGKLVQAAAEVYLAQIQQKKYAELVTSEKALADWYLERSAALAKINAAVETWSKTHLEAASFLAECGGFRSLKPACGNYTSAHLRLATERIRNIAGK